MLEETKKLFISNYNNEGDCAGLMEKTKIIEKEFRKTGKIKIIKYLHWALVERIFRLQGGTFEVKSWNFEVPFISKTKSPDENGEMITKEEKNSALFLHLSATWQGETLEEHYPIFDNQTSKIIALPDAQDLNTAKQRGMVRLIARISGIGLSIFEQTEDQFNKEDEGGVIQEPKLASAPVEEKNSRSTKKSSAKNILENASHPKVPDISSTTLEPDLIVTSVEAHAKEGEDDGSAFLEMMKGENVAPKIPTAPVIPNVEVEDDFGKETEQYAEKKLELKKFVPTHQKVILNYMTENNASLLGDLSYKQLVELEGIVKSSK